MIVEELLEHGQLTLKEIMTNIATRFNLMETDDQGL